MEELAKYKHYFIVLTALLLVLYVTEPLWISFKELQQTNNMNQKRVGKLAELLQQQQKLAEQLNIADKNTKLLVEYIFIKDSESNFKLEAQQLIEKTFSDLGCEIDRLGWQGKTLLSDEIMQWRLNVRFKGNSLCVLKVTKQLEGLTPLIRFIEYNYTGRSWEGKPDDVLTGDIDLIMWNNQQPQSAEPQI